MTVVRAGVNSAYSRNDVDQSINDVGRYVQCSNAKKKINMKNGLRYVLWKVYPYHSAIRQTDTTVKNRTLSGK